LKLVNGIVGYHSFEGNANILKGP